MSFVVEPMRHTNELALAYGLATAAIVLLASLAGYALPKWYVAIPAWVGFSLIAFLVVVYVFGRSDT